MTRDFVGEGEQTVIYELERMKRKTLSIHLEDDGRVVVKSPYGIKNSEIRALVGKKAQWILEKQALLKKQASQRIVHRFAQGEKFLFLGHMYNLHMNYHSGLDKICVSTKDDCLIVETPVVDTEQIEAAILLWYKENALRLMLQRVDDYGPQVGARPEKVMIRQQKRRWGSCNSRGELRLNWKLIMAPLPVLDYVVVHELCHLLHMDHSALFWADVGRVFPDYKTCRQWLKTYGHLLEWHTIQNTSLAGQRKDEDE